jgi:hypothetical protein
MAQENGAARFVEEGVASLESIGRTREFVGIDFCTAWPVAKSVLEMLAKIPAARWIVGILIAIGDEYFRGHCGSR